MNEETSKNEAASQGDREESAGSPPVKRVLRVGLKRAPGPETGPNHTRER